MRADRVAREEAAHAAAAVRAGRRIVRVSLNPPVCQVESHRGYRLGDAVIRIAGPLAIGDWTSRRRCDIPGLLDDRSAAEEICEEIAGHPAAALHEAEGEAEALLRDPRFLADVDRLAARLLRDGEVSGADAERLLGAADALTPPWRHEPSPPVLAPWREAVAA